MDEKFQKLKRITKQVFKHITRPFILVALAIVIVLVLIAGMQYVVNLDDAIYKEDDKNVPYTINQHSSDVSIGENGDISTSKTAKELWNEMLENDSRVNEYLDGPDELLKMMNAEAVTKYLDTRANPDEPIDWEEINKDINSKSVQGIIKLKRAKDDGETITMVYTDPETFQSYIDKYNETGAAADRERALKYFTLEKGYVGSNFGTGQKIEAGTTIMIPAGLGAVHTYMGWQTITSTTSLQYKLREQAGMNFDEEGFGRINGRYVIACTSTFGAVGDYIDFYQQDGSIIQCIIGDIKSQGDAGCNEWGHLNGNCIIEFIVDMDTWYNTGHPNPGQQGFHMEWNQNLIKAINGGSYFDNPNFGNSTIEGNGTASEDEENDNNEGLGLMKWPTDGTTITSEFGSRSSPTAGASSNHRGIDIGVNTGTNVYAAESGTVTTAGHSEAAGNWIVIDHGNGYVTKYMHNSVLKVSQGDRVEKGQIIALSGNTGVSTGPHLHFEINYNGQAIDPLTFKYDNGMGNGAGGIGSNTDSLSTGTTYYAKVATWSEITDQVKSDDPEVKNYSTTTYNMTSTQINYREFVKAYELSFNYLWSLLVIGQEKDFIFDLAELAYNSQIEITVHDNLTTNTNVSVDTYTKKTKVVTSDVKVGVTYSDTTTIQGEEGQEPQTIRTTGSTTVTGGPFEGESAKTYTTTHTVITKTNTLNVKLTKANVWIVDYSQDFAYQTPEAIVTTNTTKHDDEQYPNTPDRTDGEDGLGLAEDFRRRVQAQYAAQHTTASASVQSLQSEYYNKTVDRSVKVTNTIESKKYVESPAKVVEKTDKQSKEPNFVTLLGDHRRFKANIESATDWLFEILEKSESTEQYLDITKYLLYKSNGRDYGVTEFDFDTYKPENFANINGSTGGFSGDAITLGTYTFPHYLQQDYPGSYGDSTIPVAGCGPTSLAMILAGIKNDTSINPQTVVQNIKEYWPDGSYYVSGVGSSHCIFSSDFLQKYYGVTSQMTSNEATALDALDKGYPVIGAESGHILAIVPVSPELKEQGYRFYILDSARGHDGPYKSVADANRVVNGGLSFIAIIQP